MKYFALLGVLLVMVACAGKTDHGNFIVDNGGSGGSVVQPSSGGGGAVGVSGTGGALADAGEGGSAGASDTTSALAPIVRITAPQAAHDPNVDRVLIEDQVSVLCTVTAAADPEGAPVDPSSVKIDLLGADGKSIKSSVGVLTSNKNEYTASFVLAGLPGGLVSFQCAANDTASPAHHGSTQLDTLLDQGPEITIGEPADMSPHNLQGAMNVQFSVAPAPVAPGDQQADVSSVTLAVGGVAIPTVARGDGSYQASVAFTDKALFSAPPNGSVAVVITATNKRKLPGVATHTQSYGIVVDGVGPVVVLGTPIADAVVGRNSILTFTVTDPGSGVDRSTIAVKLNEETEFFSATDQNWTWNDTGNYTYNMGPKLVPKSSATQVLDTQVSVNVLANDNAGNAGKGNSRIFNLDNQPPIVDLDPPNVFEVRPGNDPMTVQCSDQFDPLGDRAPNDQEVIVNYGTFRSLVWDTTNSKAGQTNFFFALADRSSVRLYVQPDTDSPLLYDSDGDGVCDEIYTGSIPNQFKSTDTPLPFTELKAITPMGNPAWGSKAKNPPTDPMCKPGTDLDPAKLCTTNSIPGSDMSVVIRHPVYNAAPFEPVVYAIDPAPTSSAQLCTGNEWDIATAISTRDGMPKLGWVCMAARALDNVGNPGVSAPLRICLKSSDSDPNPCANTPPPSCTDGCTPPPHFVARVVRHD
jgi:hypothetical protein